MVAPAKLSFCRHNEVPENITAGGRQPCSAPAQLSPTLPPPSWGLEAQQVLPQQRGDREVLAEEPGLCLLQAPQEHWALGCSPVPGRWMPLSARVPAQPPALPSRKGKERVLLSHHPPPCGGLRANKRQQRNPARKSRSAPTTRRLLPAAPDRGFPRMRGEDGPWEAEQTHAEVHCMETHSDH